MNISEIKEQIAGASYEKEVEVLERLSCYTGDPSLTGYLDRVSNISFDREGKLEFESEYCSQNFKIFSVGAVLEDSIVIKQVKQSEKKCSYQLLSWEKDASDYCLISVTSDEVLDRLYERTKLFHKEPFSGEVSYALLELGISLCDILQIQRQSQEEVREVFVEEKPKQMESAFYIAN